METNQAPVKLTGSAWQVTTLAGQDPLDDHPITIEFDTEGNIAGDGSCNRFGGTCAIEGDTIKVGPLRSTRRACEPEIMEQEHKFLALLGAVTAWEIGADGTLVLRGEGGEIRAKKRTDAPEN
jgi:heat shock protein HslJ